MARMKCSEYAKHRGVSRAAVAKAIRTRQLDGSAIGFTKRGSRRVPFIKDVARADVLWTSRAQSKPAPVSAGSEGTNPPVEPVPQLGDTPGDISVSRRALEHYRALREKLEYEVASKQVVPLDVLRLEVVTHLIQARQTFLNIGWKAMSELGLSRDQGCTINDLAREIWNHMCESNARTIATATDSKLSDVAADLEGKVAAAEGKEAARK